MPPRRAAARLLSQLCSPAPVEAGHDAFDADLAGAKAISDPRARREALLRLYGETLHASASCGPATAPRTAAEWDAVLSGVPALADAATAWRAVGRPLRGPGFDSLLTACRQVTA